WLQEIGEGDAQAELDQKRYLAYALEGLISRAPEKAVRLLKKYYENGLQSLPGLPSLLDALARQLLSHKEIQQVEELLQLGAAWHVRVERATLQWLTKAYTQEGNLARAREILHTVLKREPQCPEALRQLYDLAKTEGQTAEAHTLLNKLIQANPSLATVTFAYKERTKLPSDTDRPVRIALLSSYVLDQLIPYLDFECRKASLTPEFYLAPFNQYTQEILQTSSSLYQFKPEVVFIALAVEDLFPEITGYPSRDDLDRAG